MGDHTLRVYGSMLEMLSNADNPTPIVKLNRVTPYKHTQVYVKLEWYNPFGAVKDRVAANLLRDADEKGLKFEQLVEPTSGNTGMGLAMLANARKAGFTAALSLAVPAEKRWALRLFGAKLVELNDELCPLPGAPEGAMSKATEMAKQPGWHQLNQYKNPANPDAHFRTTGPEIWKQTQGKVTHFVAGLGTCGTITGTGRFLKSQNPNVKVLGVHPMEGHDIPGVRSLKQLKLADFFMPKEYDGLQEIKNEEAYALAKRLNQEESIIAGPSSGMALAGAFKLVPDEPGAVLVVVFPDNCFKYTASFKKHVPEIFPATREAAAAPAASPVPETLRPIEAMAQASPDNISTEEGEKLMRAGAAILDVRTAGEYNGGHIAEALNIPVQAMAAGPVQGLPADKSTQIVAICGSGKRSIAAMLLLKAQGYEKVKSVKGGMGAWMQENRPLKIR
jgi:cysteine synthase/rhodanese-related sulfurtransferase